SGRNHVHGGEVRHSGLVSCRERSFRGGRVLCTRSRAKSRSGHSQARANPCCCFTVTRFKTTYGETTPTCRRRSRDLPPNTSTGRAVQEVMKRVTRVRWLLAALLLAPSAGHGQARSLYWRSLEVSARLDADGRLHVSERQAMVFSGDWNGGERR